MGQGAATGIVAAAAPETTEVELVIGGMTCAACAARVQAKLNKVDGVTAAVNLCDRTGARHRPGPGVRAGPDRTWSRRQAIPPSLLPPGRRPTADAGATADEAAVPRLRRRLILALVFFVPLTDLSLLLSIFAVDRGFPAGSGSWWRWPPRSRSGGHGRSTRRPIPQRPARHILDGHPGVAGNRGGHRLVALRPCSERDTQPCTHRNGASLPVLAHQSGRRHLFRRAPGSRPSSWPAGSFEARASAGPGPALRSAGRRRPPRMSPFSTRGGDRRSRCAATVGDQLRRPAGGDGGERRGGRGGRLRRRRA